MQRLPVMHAHMHDSNWTRRVCAHSPPESLTRYSGLLHKCMCQCIYMHVHVHVACSTSACLARYMMNAGALHMHAYDLLHKCMAVHMHMHVAGCMSMRTCMHDRTRRVLTPHQRCGRSRSSAACRWSTRQGSSQVPRAAVCEPMRRRQQHLERPIPVSSFGRLQAAMWHRPWPAGSLAQLQRRRALPCAPGRPVAITCGLRSAWLNVPG